MPASMIFPGYIAWYVDDPIILAPILELPHLIEVQLLKNAIRACQGARPSVTIFTGKVIEKNIVG